MTAVQVDETGSMRTAPWHARAEVGVQPNAQRLLSQRALRSIEIESLASVEYRCLRGPAMVRPSPEPSARRAHVEIAVG